MAFIIWPGAYLSIVVLTLWRALWFLSRRIRDGAARRETCSQEFEVLGRSRGSRKIKGTAVICGGSYSGLLAARVCHDHFERVVIIEPEEWLSTAEGTLTHAWAQKSNRSRVMQYLALNATQVSTFEGLKKLYDSFVTESRVSGILISPAMLKIDFWGNAMNLRPEDLPEHTHASRQAQETLIRRLTLNKKRYPNIQQIAGLVVGVQRHNHNLSSVRGVSVRVGKEVVTISGTLFPDCTGSSHGLKWLARAGYGHSTSPGSLSISDIVTSYNPKARFSALTFPMSASLRERIDAFLPPRSSATIYTCMANPEKQNTAAYAVEREGGMVMLCAGAWGDIELPTTLDEFSTFTKSRWMERPYPSFFLRLIDELKEAEVEPTCCKYTTKPRTYTQYHKAGDLPSNWVAIGDSVMKLNPIFGQGLTKIMAGVVCLDAELRNTKNSSESDRLDQEGPPAPILPPTFAANFFARQRAKIDHIWMRTKTADYGFESTIPSEGETKKMGRQARWYEKRLKYLSIKDNDVAMALFQVSQSLAPAVDLLHPRILWKVFLDVIRNPHL